MTERRYIYVVRVVAIAVDTREERELDNAAFEDSDDAAAWGRSRCSEVLDYWESLDAPVDEHVVWRVEQYKRLFV